MRPIPLQPFNLPIVFPLHRRQTRRRRAQTTGEYNTLVARKNLTGLLLFRLVLSFSGDGPYGPITAARCLPLNFLHRHSFRRPYYHAPIWFHFTPLALPERWRFAFAGKEKEKASYRRLDGFWTVEHDALPFFAYRYSTCNAYLHNDKAPLLWTNQATLALCVPAFVLCLPRAAAAPLTTFCAHGGNVFHFARAAT